MRRVRDGFPDAFNAIFDGCLRYVLLSAEGALDRSLAWRSGAPGIGHGHAAQLPRNWWWSVGGVGRAASRTSF